jgi:hypothetical protein
LLLHCKTIRKQINQTFQTHIKTWIETKLTLNLNGIISCFTTNSKQQIKTKQILEK